MKLMIASITVCLIISCLSYGTNDVSAWLVFASHISKEGVFSLYGADERFNHPPLIGLFVSLLLQLAIYLNVSFPFVLRLPGILANLVCAWAIYRIVEHRSSSEAAKKAATLFLWCPVTILIGGFHGDTDPIYVTLTVLSLYFIGVKNAPFRAGAALGAAINVKLIPILLIPALLGVKGRSFDFLKRFMVALICSSIPFVVTWMYVGNVFIRNVFMYNSGIEMWGMQLILAHIAALGGWNENFLDILVGYQKLARYLLFSGVGMLAVICYFNKKIDCYYAALLTYLIFLVLTPGMGVQYFAILPPLLIIASLRYSAAICSLVGLLVLMVYSSAMLKWWPITYKYQMWKPYVFYFGFIVWGILVVTLFRFKSLTESWSESDDKKITFG